MAADALIATRFDDRDDAGRVAWVTFNDPARRNALGLAVPRQKPGPRGP